MPTSTRDAWLEAAGADLVRRLGGVWNNDRGMCLCPAHEDKSPSLSVRAGHRSLLFKCFAGCSTINVMKAIRLKGLNIPSAGGEIAPVASYRPDTAMFRRAWEIWNEARPLADCAGDAYLKSRGIQASTPMLRFHPRTPLGRGRQVRFRPALIAAIHECFELVSIQRLFLDQVGNRLATDLDKPKLTLSRPLGGAVQLLPAGSVLGLAEGVETAMSAAWLLDIPVWAALGSERLHRVVIPDLVERLILLPDNDRAGRLAASRAMSAHVRPGRQLEVIWPWGRQNDWNDVLMRPYLWEGRMRADRVRKAA